MFGISPSKATVRYGLLIAIVGVPAAIHDMLPLSVSVRFVPPVLSKVGVPAQVKTLPVWRSLLSTSRRVPAAMATVPEPKGPETPPPPCRYAALAPTTRPPPLTVTDVKSFWPLSCSKPSPVLVREIEGPVILLLMLSVGASRL